MAISLNECDFFVPASGLPLLMMHRGMAELLGNAMGKFKMMDNTDTEA